jgi:UDP-sulfoquinovose synthase
MIAKMSGVEIRFYANPRKEDRDNDLKMSCQNFLSLGLNPITLQEGLVDEIYKIADKYRNRCDTEKIICTSVWNKNILVDREGSKTPIEGNNILKQA